ncbi:Fc.00g010510.m01.CDS01 [Cosmosporella sp. VM-42]
MATSLLELGSLQCEFFIPSEDNPQEGVSRWSDTNIERAALVITPRKEEDVQASVRIAKVNKLTIVTGGGGHGTFVTVGSRTLYLDMKHFNKIQLVKEQGLVKVGGGVVSGDLLKTLAAENYYTPLPNSNAVGVVGCLIGGGSTPLNGLHGWMADIVVSFRLVTSEGDIIEVSGSSTGENLVLFNALCGAGHGLCVITSATTPAYPISGLNMSEDKIWMRSLVFPGPALDTAVETFINLLRPLPAASTSITFARSPPGTPTDGVPFAIVGCTYFGPAADAEKHAAVLFREDVIQEAISANTAMVPWANINDRFEPNNLHGGHKAIASCLLERTDAETIKIAFEQWLSATKKHQDAQKSPLVISSFSSTKHSELGQDIIGAGKFLESRDRDISVMLVAICEKQETMAAVRENLDGIMTEFRRSDEGSVPRSFPNNLRFNMNLEEMFDKERLAELREIKEIWDGDGIFWSPYYGA